MARDRMICSERERPQVNLLCLFACANPTHSFNNENYDGVTGFQPEHENAIYPRPLTKDGKYIATTEWTQNSLIRWVERPQHYDGERLHQETLRFWLRPLAISKPQPIGLKSLTHCFRTFPTLGQSTRLTLPKC